MIDIIKESKFVDCPKNGVIVVMDKELTLEELFSELAKELGINKENVSAYHGLISTFIYAVNDHLDLGLFDDDDDDDDDEWNNDETP